MKMSRFYFAFTFFVLFATRSFAQTAWDTIFYLGYTQFDEVSGYGSYPPNYMAPGQVFSLFHIAFPEDLDNDWVLNDQREDSVVHLIHYYYQQTYKGLRVELARYKEHVDANNEFVIHGDGKIVSDLDADATPISSESEAMGQILNEYSGNTFAWMDDAWEAQIQEDQNDPYATNYPIGELIWAVDSLTDLPSYYIPGQRYILAWAFEVLSLDPAFHRRIFVNANTGEIFREDELDCFNGPGSTWSHGTRTIDTQKPGGNWILFTDDNNRNIHTKKSGILGPGWGTSSNYSDSDDDWDVADIAGTSTHWFASESWDFFQDAPFNYNVRAAFGNFSDHELRIIVDIDDDGGGPRGRLYNGYHYLQIMKYAQGDDQGKALDIIGHEFTHRMQESRPNYLKNDAQAGTLKEGLGDIFGELIELRTDGSMDWIHGGDPGTVETRNFTDPKSDGSHNVINSPCSTKVAGQPNTVLGENWYTGACDNHGMHGNSGVVNYWFYLLSEGGNGTNDLPHSDTYDVQGIGTEKAGLIAFYIMMYYLTDDDDFEKARASSILAAQALFGPCSNEEIQTTNAWYAVGVGDVSACPPITSQDPAHAKLEPIMIFPNPSSGTFLVEFSDIQEFQSLEVFDLMGTKIRSYSLTTSNQIEVDLSSYASGIFIAKIQEKAGSRSFQLVKQ